jgi:hypothetical protein
VAGVGVGAGGGFRGGAGGRLNPVLRGLLDVAALGAVLARLGRVPLPLVGYVLVGPVHLPLLTVVELEDLLAHLRGEVAAISHRSLRAAAAGRCWARPAHMQWVPLLLEHLVDEPVELRLLGPGRVGYGRPGRRLRPCVLLLAKPYLAKHFAHRGAAGVRPRAQVVPEVCSGGKAECTGSEGPV